MTQVCRQCSRINPPDASYCYHDGAHLGGHSANGGPVNAGSIPFPSLFVFPNGLSCRNFDQLALTCQEQWPVAVDLVKQGYLASFLGSIGRSDLAGAAKEAADFPDRDRGLDLLLAKLPSHALQSPRLNAEPSELNLGQIEVGTDRDIEIHLSNLGMRLLYGAVVSDCKWLAFGEGHGSSQQLFQFGAEKVLTVRVKGQHLRAGSKPLEGNLIVDSNGGSATIRVRADVPITPFAKGVLAGSTTPRQIAEKAKAAPREAAVLFESGAVAAWFTRNGWIYPVQGPNVGGIGGVQQFFEALGLAKPPKVELKTTALNLRGDAGRSVQANIDVFTRDNKVLYAHATCDQFWVDVSKVKLSGKNGVITVAVPSIPNRPGETIAARVTVQGNGNQRFVVPLTLAVGGGNPFAGLDRDAGSQLPPPLPISRDGIPSPPAVGLIEDVRSNPFAVIPPAITKSGILIPPSSPASQAAALAPSAVPDGNVMTVGNGTSKRGDGFLSFSKHLVPLGILALVLLGLMVRDLLRRPAAAGVAEDEIDPTPRLSLEFDFGPDRKNTATFGLAMLDPQQKNVVFKRLTFDVRGQTNSTMALIDGKPFSFARQGKWEKLPFASGTYRGMTAPWMFPELISATQIVEIMPGEPVEVTPNVFRRLLDTCVIRYRLENRDSRPHHIGIRVMIDTLIGDNDGVPFTIPGVPGLVSGSRDMRGSDIPDFIHAQEFSDLADPGTVVQMKMRLGGRVEAPSRVSLTHWPDPILNEKQFRQDYEIRVTDILEDSCIVLYWDPMELAPGQKREVGFSYGLGNIARGKISLLSPAPGAVGQTFQVVALVADAKKDQTATLEVPPGFDLSNDTPRTQTVPLAKMNADGKLQASPVTWQLTSRQAGSFTFIVTTADPENPAQVSSDSRRVTIRSVGIFQ